MWLLISSQVLKHPIKQNLWVIKNHYTSIYKYNLGTHCWRMWNIRSLQNTCSIWIPDTETDKPKMLVASLNLKVTHIQITVHRHYHAVHEKQWRDFTLQNLLTSSMGHSGLLVLHFSRPQYQPDLLLGL